MKIID